MHSDEPLKRAAVASEIQIAAGFDVAGQGICHRIGDIIQSNGFNPALRVGKRRQPREGGERTDQRCAAEGVAADD